jgi:glycosyltransferase involved in cell wall biosynthesis
MENLAHQLRVHLDEFVDVVPLINRRGKKALPTFLPYAALTAVRMSRRGDVDAVHLADALLAPVGAAVKTASSVPVTVTVCGLDVTYPNRVYQGMVTRALRELDMAMPISRATEHAMRERTGHWPRTRVIPLGVNALPSSDAAAVSEFERAVGPIDGRRVVTTVGRLIERKGAAWFAGNVLPRLPDDVVYVVIGKGPQHDAIVRAAGEAIVSDRLRIAGPISAGAVAAAYARTDVFVMPNIPVAGDMEGFGLVALEASIAGVPVVASALEGITEAVQHDRNGLLVAPGDADAWVAALNRVLSMTPEMRRGFGAHFARFTDQEYGWRRTAQRYAEAITSTVEAGAALRKAA